MTTILARPTPPINADILGPLSRLGRRPKQKVVLVSLLAELKAGPWQPEGGWDDPRILKNCNAVVAAGFARKTLALACVIVELLAQRQPDTVRGILYATVSVGWLPDTSRASYRKVQRLLKILRKRRVLPFLWIVDNIRATEKPSSWSGLADFADTVRDAYRRDFWASLPAYVCVVVEKDTAAGRIAPVTREYDVPLHPLRGYSSTTFAYTIGEEWREIEKPIHVYYVGDHDPSGRGIEASIRSELAEFAGKQFTWTRLAVEPEHFDTYSIIPLEPKRKDTRYRKFVKQYGPRCAEVEAVPADELREMVRKAIETHIPQAQWSRLKKIEEQEKESWATVMSSLKTGGAA